MLPFAPPVEPMLARLERELPIAPDLVYEPKWDGFRSIVFRDGDEVNLESRNQRPLTRYFPEVAEALRDQLPDRCVLDGEIVIAGPDGLDFDALQLRLHPAASRVKKLAAEMPGSFVAFDLLALGDDDLRGEPFSERRRILAQELVGVRPPVHLTPSTDDPDVARDWFSRFEGAGLDGVVAKDRTRPYQEGERVMFKIKHERTADCAVAGFRWHKQDGVGSLLLGLFDRNGVLHRAGVCSGFSKTRRQDLVQELDGVRLSPGEPHPWVEAGSDPATSSPQGPTSRWTQGRDTAWEPLSLRLVCEVAYDHLQGDRFRHATSFRRWRSDREPGSCTYDQLDVPVPWELRDIFSLPTT
jgi:ATP-dependent DNA ligase